MQSERQQGIIEKYFEDRGFGFILSAGAPNLFFHCRDFLRRNEAAIQPGATVTYEIGAGRDGRKCAVAIDFAE